MNNKLVKTAIIYGSIIVIIIIALFIKLGLDTRQSNKLEQATEVIKSKDGNSNVKTDVFSSSDNCMMVSVLNAQSDEQQQPQYNIACEENGKQIIKLGPASSFSIRDMMSKNIPIKIQAKATGESIDELNKIRTEYNNGVYLANQVVDGIKGAPTIGGYQTLITAGMDIDQSALNITLQFLRQYYADINRGYANGKFTPVGTPEKQILDLSMSNGLSNLDNPDYNMYTSDLQLTSGTSAKSSKKIIIKAVFNGNNDHVLTLKTIIITDTDGNNPVTVYDSDNGVVPQTPPN